MYAGDQRGSKNDGDVEMMQKTSQQEAEQQAENKALVLKKATSNHSTLRSGLIPLYVTIIALLITNITSSQINTQPMESSAAQWAWGRYVPVHLCG